MEGNKKKKIKIKKPTINNLAGYSLMSGHLMAIIRQLDKGLQTGWTFLASAGQLMQLVVRRKSGVIINHFFAFMMMRVMIMMINIIVFHCNCLF